MMTKKVKVVCCGCDGKGYTIERKWPSRKEIKVNCGVCYGAGYVYDTAISSERRR